MYKADSQASDKRGRINLRARPLRALLLLFAALLFSQASLGESCGGDGGKSDPCAETDAGSNASPTPKSDAQNPIDVITGNKYEREIDHQPRQGSLQSDLAFVRHYNSLNHQINRGLGPGWSSTWHVSLGSTGEGERQIVQSDGRRIVFQQTADEGDRQRFDTVNPGDGYLQQNNGRYHWHLPDGRELSFNGKGRLSAIDHPGGQRQTLHYQGDRLARVEDKQGRQLTFSYYEQPGLRRYAPGTSTQPAGQIEETQAAAGLLKSVGLPDGKTIQYRYDGLGNLKQVNYPDGRIRNYHYDNDAYPHALTGISDAGNKRLATWGYDNEGRANHYHKPGGVDRIDLTYTPPSEADGIGTTELTNSLGQKSSYRWQHQIHDAQALLIESECPGCSDCPEANVRYEYTEKNQIQAVHRRSGTTHYKYDGQGRTTELRVTYADGTQQNVQYSYEGNSHKPSTIIRPSINPAGEHRVEINYNSDQQPTAITERGYTPVEAGGFVPIERTTELSYAEGNLTAIDGPREDVKDLINLSYDNQQRLNTLTGPDGRTMTVQGYDNYGRPIEIQSGSQSPITIVYTAQGQIAKVTQANQSVSYTYTESGQLKSLTSPDGETLTIDYDEADRVIGLQSNSGQQLTIELDTEGRTLQSHVEENGLLNRVSYLYDAQNRLQAKTAANGDLLERYRYDDEGDLVGVEDIEGNRQRLSYGNPTSMLSGGTLDRIGLIQSPPGDADSARLSGYSDQRDNETLYIQDDFGQVVDVISPDRGLHGYRYDAAGNIIEETNAEGETTTYQYDAANRVIQWEDSDGITSIDYHKDNGKPFRIAGPHSSETYAYDSEGQLTEHIRAIDGHTFTTEYAYDEQQRLAQKSLPDGQVLNYHYYEEGSQRGKLHAITQQTYFGLGQETLIGEIDHDKADGITGHTHGNGIRTEYRYDDKGQLLQVSNNQTLQLDYSYDEQGRISGIDLDGLAHQYAYDPLGRLSRALTPTEQWTYNYDAAGNRIETSRDDVTTSYSYSQPGEGNRLQQAGDIAYEYNAAGSPIEKGDLSYEYNSDQRPIKVSRNGQTLAEYAYNSFGERIKKVVYANNQRTVTYYFYDGEGRLTAEADEGGDITAQYVYLKEYQPIAKLEGKEIYALHTDRLGTPLKATNEDAQVVWSADYSPFGKARITTQEITLNLRLPGQYLDLETGTHYNYQRDYDPESGRYLTGDPIGLQGGINLYAYVTNSPLTIMDPRGESIFSWLGKKAAQKVLKKEIKDALEIGVRSRLKKIGNSKLRKELETELDAILAIVDALDGFTWLDAIELIPVAGDAVSAYRCSKAAIDVAKRIKALERRVANALKLRPARNLLGKTDGGPGKWEISPKRTKGQDYQEQVTGVQRGVEYNVNGRLFDGFDPKRNKLIDAKVFSSWPIDKKFSKDSVLKEASGQVDDALSTGAKIEWQVATKDKADLVRKWLQENPNTRGINVVHVPKIQ